MDTPNLYMYSPHTREYTGSRPATVVGGKGLTQSAFATTTAPPEDVPGGKVAVWAGNAWDVVEDHRQQVDDDGTITGGTAYWLPDEGDSYTSPARYMRLCVLKSQPTGFNPRSRTGSDLPTVRILPT